MPWEPGQSGNPAGGSKPKEKRFLTMLERACAADDYKRLRAAAEKLLDEAAKGEAWAIQQLADRFDGKAAQAVEVETTVHDGDISRTPLTPEQWEDKHGVGAAAGTATRAH